MSKTYIWRLIRRLSILSILVMCLMTVKSSALTESIFDFGHGGSSATEERKIQFKYLPPNVMKIVEVRNLNKDAWLRDLEIEMKNISGKPIYLLDIDIVLPEISPREGDRLGSIWQYGNTSLTSNDKLAEPSDIPIKLNDSVVVKVPKKYIDWLETGEYKDLIQSVTKLEVEFTFINFGDGTGYIAGKPLKDQTNNENEQGERLFFSNKNSFSHLLTVSEQKYRFILTDFRDAKIPGVDSKGYSKPELKCLVVYTVPI